RATLLRDWQGMTKSACLSPRPWVRLKKSVACLSFADRAFSLVRANDFLLGSPKAADPDTGRAGERLARPEDGPRIVRALRPDRRREASGDAARIATARIHGVALGPGPDPHPLYRPDLLRAAGAPAGPPPPPPPPAFPRRRPTPPPAGPSPPRST